MKMFESVCCMICFLFASFIYLLMGCEFLKVMWETALGFIQTAFHFLFFM